MLPPNSCQYSHCHPASATSAAMTSWNHQASAVWLLGMSDCMPLAPPAGNFHPYILACFPFSDRTPRKHTVIKLFFFFFLHPWFARVIPHTFAVHLLSCYALLVTVFTKLPEYDWFNIFLWKQVNIISYKVEFRELDLLWVPQFITNLFHYGAFHV